MTTLTLSSKPYTLDLQGEITYNTWTGGNSESGDKFCSKTYWSGQARLSIGSNEIVFNFETRKHREISLEEIGSLESEFLQISGISKKATIANKEQVIENFCGALWTKVWDEFNNQKGKERLFFTTTTPPVIDGKSLIQQGVIIEPGYQMELLSE